MDNKRNHDLLLHAAYEIPERALVSYILGEIDELSLVTSIDELSSNNPYLKQRIDDCRIIININNISSTAEYCEKIIDPVEKNAKIRRAAIKKIADAENAIERLKNREAQVSRRQIAREAINRKEGNLTKEN